MAIGAYGDKGTRRGSKKEEEMGQRRASNLTPTPYNNQYRGSTQNPGFSQVKAVDQSKAIAQQEEQRLQQMREQETALDRNSKLGKFYLDGVQKVQREQLTADQIAENADRKGKQELFKGLMELSDTAAKGFQLYSEIKEENELNEMAMDSILGGPAAELVNDPGLTTQGQEQEIGVISTATAVGEITDDPATADALLEPVRTVTNTNNLGTVNVLEAGRMLPGYVTDFIESGVQVRLPNGDIISSNGARSLTELRYITRLAINQWGTETGVSGMDPRRVREFLLPEVGRVESSIVATYGSQIIQGNRDAAILTTEQNASAQMGAGLDLVGIGGLYNTVLAGVMSSGEVGGNRSLGVERTVEILIAQALLSDNPQGNLELLLQVQQIPGQAGTEFGAPNSPYRGIILAGIDDANTRDAQRASTESRLQDDRRDQIEARRLAAISEPGLSFEDIQRINQQAAEEHRQNGGSASLTQAANLESDNYSDNPFFMGELNNRWERGERFTEAELTDWVSRGSLSPEQARTFGWNGAGNPSNGDLSTASTAGVTGIVENEVRTLVHGAATTSGMSPDYISSYMQGSGKNVMTNITGRMLYDIKQWQDLEGPKSEAEIQEYITRVLVPRYQPLIEGVPAQAAIPGTPERTETRQVPGQQGTQEQVVIPAVEGVPAQPAHIAYTPTNPDGTPVGVEEDIHSLGFSGVNSHYDHDNWAPGTNGAYRDYSRFDTTTILNGLDPSREGRTDGRILTIRPSIDLVLTAQELTQAHSARVTGNPYPSRITELASSMGLTPDQFVRMQGQAYGIPEISTYEPVQFIDEREIATPASGTKYLMDLGMPEQGAAFFSANAMQESGWDGQRAPWVLDDGAGTNKGIFSWNRERIPRVEGWLQTTYGVSDLTQATNAQQVNAALWEMKNFYPSAYATFMNPNATTRDLKQASMTYLGYGDAGLRYTTYLTQARAGIPTRGTVTGGNPKVTLASYAPQVQSITYDTGQPGIDVWFEDHQFPAVLNGTVKDVSFQGGNGYGYGNYVVVESIDPRTGRKVDVLYSHLASRPNLRVGQTITAGDIIGRQGGTGRVVSSDGTIASIDFLAVAPAGSTDMTPYRDYNGLRSYVAQSLGG